MAEVRAKERLLAEVEQEGEVRRVSVIEGEAMTILESSRGPVTELAYGSPSHGHKILCSAAACGLALGVGEAQVVDALARLFAQSDEVPLLSDVMDLFDKAQVHYSYVAWSDEGDAVYRPKEA